MRQPSEPSLKSLPINVPEMARFIRVPLVGTSRMASSSFEPWMVLLVIDALPSNPQMEAGLEASSGIAVIRQNTVRKRKSRYIVPENPVPEIIEKLHPGERDVGGIGQRDSVASGILNRPAGTICRDRREYANGQYPEVERSTWPPQMPAEFPVTVKPPTHPCYLI